MPRFALSDRTQVRMTLAGVVTTVTCVGAASVGGAWSYSKLTSKADEAVVAASEAKATAERVKAETGEALREIRADIKTILRTMPRSRASLDGGGQ